MAQGILAGCTSYSDQSLIDIAEDVRRWIGYCQRTKGEFESDIEAIKADGMWEGTIPLDFRLFCLSIPKLCDTYIYDFQIVLKSIENDCISQRDIKLMENIHRKAHETERDCVEAYKHSSNRCWVDYENPKFEKIEGLYSKGRDFCVAMFDVDNAAGRMEDYMKKENTIIEKETHIDQSINLGNNNNINMNGKHAIFGNVNNADSDTKNPFINKFVIPIIVGLIVAVITFKFGIN